MHNISVLNEFIYCPKAIEITSVQPRLFAYNGEQYNSALTMTLSSPLPSGWNEAYVCIVHYETQANATRAYPLEKLDSENQYACPVQIDEELGQIRGISVSTRNSKNVSSVNWKETITKVGDTQRPESTDYPNSIADDQELMPWIFFQEIGIETNP